MQKYVESMSVKRTGKSKKKKKKAALHHLFLNNVFLMLRHQDFHLLALLYQAQQDILRPH